jgi:hypothetical protein
MLKLRAPVILHRQVYTKTTQDTSGEYMTFEELHGPRRVGALPRKSASPPLHIHPLQTEYFEVIQGKMGYVLDGEEGFVQPHDTQSNPVSIPPSVPHTFWNAANETELEVRITLRPARRSEEFFRTLIGFEKDYGRLGNVNPLQLLVTFVHGDVQLADVPSPVWTVIKHVIVPLAEHGLGFKPFYDEYTHMGKT